MDYETEKMLQYMRDLIRDTQRAKLCAEDFSEDNRAVAEGLTELGQCIKETMQLAGLLADGKIDEDFPIKQNGIAAPLKTVQGNLRHLTWAAERVAAGDYSQKISSMGSLSNAFDKMTEQLQEYREKVEMQLNTDYLTGIGNRRLFTQVAEQLFAMQKQFVLAYIDVDGLKACNDKFGHTEGDHYILFISKCLKELLPEHCQIFRVGGDEFLIISEQMRKKDLEEALQNVRKNVYREKTKHFYLRDFSFGCAGMDPSSGLSLTKLLRCADREMYHAKMIHYLQRKQNGQTRLDMTGFSLDKTGLESRIFEIFSNTSQNRYMYLCNMKTNVSRWSVKAVEDFDLPGEYMYDAGTIWAEYVHPDDRKLYMDDVNAVMSGRKVYHDVEYRARNKDGNYIVCSCMGAVLKGNGEEPDLFAGTITNHGVVDLIDPVTNLYNVYALLNQIRKIREQKKSVRFLCVGIHQFTEVNTAWGYDFGNRILHAFAAKIEEVCGETAKLYRLDGVKFLLLFEQSEDGVGTECYKQLVKIGREQVCVDSLRIPIEIAGAYLEFDQITVDENLILTELIHAIRQAKQDRTGKLIIYGDDQNEKLRDEMRLLDCLQTCILDGCSGFSLYYQPQVDPNGKWIGVEALLRWQHEAFGQVPPSVYIPLLENDSSFYELGLWILRTALYEMRPFVQKDPNFTVSVNISYRQMEHYGFRDDVMRIVAEENFPAKNLILELTEHCQTIHTEILKKDILFYQSFGIQVAADDFGCGYSSLSLMRMLPFDYIKIDQTFVCKILESEGDQFIVEAIISCAQKLGIQVCVEGVENEEVFAFMKRYGAEAYQGYYFARPMPVNLIKELKNKIDND